MLASHADIEIADVRTKKDYGYRQEKSQLSISPAIRSNGGETISRSKKNRNSKVLHHLELAPGVDDLTATTTTQLQTEEIRIPQPLISHTDNQPRAYFPGVIAVGGSNGVDSTTDRSVTTQRKYDGESLIVATLAAPPEDVEALVADWLRREADELVEQRVNQRFQRERENQITVEATQLCNRDDSNNNDDGNARNDKSTHTSTSSHMRIWLIMLTVLILIAIVLAVAIPLVLTKDQPEETSLEKDNNNVPMTTKPTEMTNRPVSSNETLTPSGAIATSLPSLRPTALLPSSLPTMLSSSSQPSLIPTHVPSSNPSLSPTYQPTNSQRYEF